VQKVDQKESKRAFESVVLLDLMSVGWLAEVTVELLVLQLAELTEVEWAALKVVQMAVLREMMTAD